MFNAKAETPLEIKMETNAAKNGRTSVLAAGASLIASAVIFTAFWKWLAFLGPNKGSGYPAIFLLLACAGGGVAGFICFFAAQMWKVGRKYAFAAWVSLAAAVVISVFSWLWIAFIEGVGPPNELPLFVFLLWGCAAGGLAGSSGLVAYQKWNISRRANACLIAAVAIAIVLLLWIASHEGIDLDSIAILFAGAHVGLVALIGYYAERWQGLRVQALAACASLIVALLVFSVLWGWQDLKYALGPLTVSVIYIILLQASAAAGTSALFGVFGIRSWRNALIVVPVATVGICINSVLVLVCLHGYALTCRYWLV